MLNHAVDGSSCCVTVLDRADPSALAQADVVAGEQESLQEILHYQNNCILALKFQDLEGCSLSWSLRGARVSTHALFSGHATS